VQASQAAQQDVLRSPATDAAQAAQSRHGRRIVEVLELVEIEPACGDAVRKRDDGCPLLPAEAEGAELVRLEPGEVIRRRKGISSIGGYVPSGRAGCRQAVEQLDG
jgi:hypothetical protein